MIERTCDLFSRDVHGCALFQVFVTFFWVERVFQVYLVLPGVPYIFFFIRDA